MNKRKKIRKNISEFSWSPKYDAVIAAPHSHKVLLENEKIRVVEVVVKPGKKEPMHTHRWPSIMIVDRPTKLLYYNKNNKVKFIPIKYKRKIEWMDSEELHAVKNIDKKTYHAFRVEFKK